MTYAYSFALTGTTTCFSNIKGNGASVLRGLSIPEHHVLQRLHVAAEQLHRAVPAAPWLSWQQPHTALYTWYTESVQKQHRNQITTSTNNINILIIISAIQKLYSQGI